MSGGPDVRRILLVGGSGGLVGRAVLTELAPHAALRSLHRHPVPAEARAGVEWVPGDAGAVADWGPLLRDTDVVVNLAWYRWTSAARFAELARGLERLIRAAQAAGLRRFVQVSVPGAPDELERGLPYLFEKRSVDRALASSGLSYRILRPTMLYGRGDRLLGVMLRLMRRYRAFPMFEEGDYHVSPYSAADLARAIHRESVGHETGSVDLGGPARYRYRDLTDAMFEALGRRPRYVRFSATGALRLARLMRGLGSTLLYPYEVRWLLSDRLGLPPDPTTDRPLRRVETYLASEAAWLAGRSAPTTTIAGAR